MAEYKHNCSACAVREACKHTFARYYLAKSHGGIGCNRPTGDERWAAEVMRVVAADEAAKREEEITQGELFNAESEQTGREFWHKYEVIHRGRRYETTAKSEAGAINFIRFKLYGMKPLDQCGSFEVRRIAETKFNADKPRSLSKSDALARLRRMAS